METLKFKAGTTYQMTFVTDSQLKPEFVCIKRTEKSATFTDKHETFTRRIKELDGIEYIMYGSYSMAPCISARRSVEK